MADSKKSLVLAKALAKHGYPFDDCVKELVKANNSINEAATALIQRYGPPKHLAPPTQARVSAAPVETASESNDRKVEVSSDVLHVVALRID